MYKLLKITALSIILFTSGCQEVIEMDLNKSPEKYVIEAYLTNNQGQASVTISKTLPFNSEQPFQKVSTAEVIISGDDITPTKMLPSADGVYTHLTLKGTPNNTYYLTVTIDGKVFKASCKMPPVVPLDEVYMERSVIFGEREVDIYIKFNDPLGPGNCYRAKTYVNGVYSKSLDVFKDDFFDGKNSYKQHLKNGFKRGERSGDKVTYAIGDKVRVDFQTISEPVYKYWYSSDSNGSDSDGGSSNAASANPNTNIDGGALGCFSAHTQQSKELTVK